MQESSAIVNMNMARAVLRREFGYQDFREGQAEVIEAVLRGRNCIVVMPTGGGKSLCYQLPALLLPGRTIVISPLIALMKDQTETLQQRNIKAAFINSSIPFEDQKSTLTAFAAGRIRILYIAPERFRSRFFIDVLRHLPLSLFAVDEAHCISHWGHDFRPDYLKLREVIQEIGQPPVLALTATATPRIRMDIAEQLGLTDVDHFVAGFDRTNLRLQVQHTKTQKAKLDLIEQLLRRTRGSGIIYAATRKVVEFVAKELLFRRVRAIAYHAGLPTEDRGRAQTLFMEGEVDVIVATNAFGMGIDKPDIRYVVHHNIPESIESYYQEVGRAGRDGGDSVCTLLFTHKDVQIQEYFLAADNPHPDLIAQVYQFLVNRKRPQLDITSPQIAEAIGERNALAVNTSLIRLEKAGHIQRLRSTGSDNDHYQIRLLDSAPAEALRIDKVELARRAAFDQWKLQQMVDYAMTDHCLRGYILDYFGDRKQFDRCGSCSACLGRGNRPRVSVQPRVDAMDDFFIDSAPTGSDLRETLRQQSHRQRKLESIETNLAPEPTTPKSSAIIENMDVARMIVECVAAMNFRFGQSTIIGVLRGSTNKTVKRWRLDQTPHYGKLTYLKQAEIQQVMDLLISQNYLVIRKTKSVYPLIGLTEEGWDFIKD